MKMNPIRPLATPLKIIVASFILISCAQEQSEKERDLVTFPLKGEVVRVDRESKRLTVAHEEIPDYMDAMTMAFRIKDSTIFDQISVGDSIEATLAVSRVESWLEGVQVVGSGDASYLTPDDVMFKRLYKEGEPLPDLGFIDQENRPFAFSSLEGKAVALTFIYTRCPLPDFCILMSNNFSKVQDIMKRDRALDESWHLVSVSFDPDNDTPEVLQRYGRQYGADFDVWDFITADKSVMNSFATGFDLYVASGDGGLIDHTLRTVLLDTKGNLVTIIKGNSWTAEDLAAELKKIARGE